MSDSNTLFSQAQDVIPGGVNSPVRAFGSVGGTPVFLERGAGSRVYSVEGVEYIDFCGSWGPLILGHAHQDVVAAVSEAASNGMTFGASTEKEVRFARQICDANRLPGNGRRGRHKGSSSGALPRTPPRSPCPASPDACLPGHRPGIGPPARRSTRHRT